MVSFVGTTNVCIWDFSTWPLQTTTTLSRVFCGPNRLLAGLLMEELPTTRCFKAFEGKFRKQIWILKNRCACPVKDVMVLCQFLQAFNDMWLIVITSNWGQIWRARGFCKRIKTNVLAIQNRSGKCFKWGVIKRPWYIFL